MPKDLAALLVDEGAASAEAVARALDRQREEGGALDTALLEERVLPEAELVAWLARAAELPAAPETAWDASDARARRVFPSRVAERHGLAPFALDGRELSLVATFPVDLALLDEISFMLSLDLTAHVGPEWRVRELIHRLYGSPLSPRLAALAAGGGAPVEAPPGPLAAEASGAGDAAGAAPEGAPPPPPPPTGFSRDASEPLEPLAAALQQALEDVDVTVFDEEASGGGPASPSGAEAGARAGGDDAGTEGPAPDRTVPPRWSLEDARAALAAARHRDDVVLTAIRYARDFFEYAAVFAVTRDAVAGHDALGLQDERDRARSVAIWATDPGIFKTVIETRAPHLGPVSREASGNEAILSGLGRDAPRTVLLYPVLLRDRPVCVVYADNGEAPVSPRRLGDLLLFLSGVGAALERILQERKRRVKARPAAATDPGAAAAIAEPSRRAGPEAPDAGAGPRARSEAGAVRLERADPEPLPVPVDVPEPARGAAAAPPSLEEAGLTDAELPVDLPPFEFEAPPAEAPPAPAASGGALEDVEEAFFSSGPRAPAAPEGEKGAPAESSNSGPSPTATATATASPSPSPTPSPSPSPTPTSTSAPTPTPTATSTSTAPAPPAPPATSAAPAPADAPPPEPPTLAALADRALDPDGAAAAAACEALAARRREPASRAANEKLRRALLSGISSRATRAARALGAIRDVEAIPLLIQVLETSEPETAGASADALAAITLQRLGPDARKWLAWWKQNRGRGRAEWLFSGLTSADRETRVAASLELSLAAPAPVAYSADLPPDERERLARAWAGWWARSGHVL